MKKITSLIIVFFIYVGFIAAQTSVDFKITTWNVEWLSCTTRGPTDEDLQMNNVATVIKAMNSDIVALQEVGTSATYATIDILVGILGSEWAGNIVPWRTGNCNQSQGIVYKKSKAQLVNSFLIRDGGSSYNWASGRYPALYNVNLLVGNEVVPVSLVNIHAKAMGDATSYSRRVGASEGLKTLFDSNTYNTKNIILIGDFNDYLTGTQCKTCSPISPYKNFMDDTENYKGLTTNLWDYSYNSPVIDNIVISNELFENYKQSSTKKETTATQSVNDYRNTTSDHIPISSTFSFSTNSVTPPECENINYSETFAQSLGEFTQYSANGYQTWHWTTYGAYISGYSPEGNNPNEDWLISPAFDLSNKKSATLVFNHALNYAASESDRINNHTLWFSADYNDGVPENTSWTQVAIPNMPSSNDWTYVHSGNIEVPNQLLQNNVRFAFKYISTPEAAAIWEIKDLTFGAECLNTNIPNPPTENKNIVYVSNKQIKIDNRQPEPVTVYDTMGRELIFVPAVQSIDIPISQSGIYIVRNGSEIHKIIIQ